MGAPLPFRTDITPHEAVRRRMAEARQIASELAAKLVEDLAQVALDAEALASLGEAVPPGVRDLARRIGHESDARARMLGGVISRIGRRR
jgi:hypothetical protein